MSKNDIDYIFFEFFNESKGEVVREFSDVIKEGSDHIIFKPQQRYFVLTSLSTLSCNYLLK